MNELETVARLDNDQVPVVIIYELDGYKPIGLWVQDSRGNDITCEIDEAEYDRLYEKATRHTAGCMCEAAAYFLVER